MGLHCFLIFCFALLNYFVLLIKTSFFLKKNIYWSLRVQNEVDLFATQPTSSSSVTATADLFSVPEPVAQPESKLESSGPTNNNIVDPFAAVPLNNLDGSDLFGEFASQSNTVYEQPSRGPVSDGSHDNMNGKPLAESKIPPKKDAFLVKSGIWADSLSRGLIDLNISARKFIILISLTGFPQHSIFSDKLL